jgi:hypothetical protein
MDDIAIIVNRPMVVADRIVIGLITGNVVQGAIDKIDCCRSSVIGERHVEGCRDDIALVGLRRALDYICTKDTPKSRCSTAAVGVVRETGHAPFPLYTNFLGKAGRPYDGCDIPKFYNHLLYILRDFEQPIYPPNSTCVRRQSQRPRQHQGELAHFLIRLRNPFLVISAFQMVSSYLRIA